MLRLSPDTLSEELQQITASLGRVQAMFENGVPGEEMPSEDLNVERFEMRVVAEIALIAERLSALSEILKEEF